MSTVEDLDERVCWEAVVDRDARFDQQFVFGVVTTGVFCKPSCRSRRALRRNVRFFRTPKGAEASGLRPCLRCRPTDDSATDLQWIRDLCELLREQGRSGERLTLGDLAKRVGKNPKTLRKQFQAAVGVTPRQYLESCRLETFREEVRAIDSITDAVYAAGFGSSSRLYERVDSFLGMTPSDYRDGGGGVEISYTWIEGDFGLLLVAATDRGLCSVEFGEDRESLLQKLADEFPTAVLSESSMKAGDAQFRAWVEGLGRTLRDGEVHPDLPLDVRGSAFRIKVWRYLQSIPRGETRSYGEVAAAVGQPLAARAVAGACAGNRVAVLIPCHRVIRANGDLGGYRWGTDRKEYLLAEERSRD
ncbi:MAG: bifunctional DNA-binding transcriptional regulator/O6-methylguanine-DNA methyltransferase Ada [Thermoanaerobaculia bacterium]|nr:bifunctional DNA-binding transcriptional regulator/O6-methylguanine-DNA methyltransferase Ada [Thermoanaerobaculia bacterium]